MREVPFAAADILLPKTITKVWGVPACDQHTSEPEFWEETAREVGENPSTLRLILPEVYLGESDVSARVDAIHETMRAYLSAGIFAEYKDAMIYVRREQSDGKIREGIVGRIDLENYDFTPESKTLVRATEATVRERIPKREEIRRGAVLEASHVMLLIDDPEKTVIEPLSASHGDLLYDTELLRGGGRVQGRLLSADEQAAVLAALAALQRQTDPENPLVYAVGDGNHSLAAAKALYEEWKAAHPGEPTEREPLRWALCELVNLHSPALVFEPIHRVLRGVDADAFLKDLCQDGEVAENTREVEILHGGKTRKYAFPAPFGSAVGDVQDYLDRWLQNHAGTVDYIHGEDTLARLAQAPDAVGILLPAMPKSGLFEAVRRQGTLPRKSFSMGQAADKRYYMECRRIR